MSVPVDARKPSEMDYIMKARELLLYTMGRHSGMSAKLKTLVGDELIKSTWTIYNSVCYANEIKVVSFNDYAERRSLLLKASRTAKTLSPKIEVAQYYIYNRLREIENLIQQKRDNNEAVPDSLQKEYKAFKKAYEINWIYWGNLIRSTISLCNGVLRYDIKTHSAYEKRIKE